MEQSLPTKVWQEQGSNIFPGVFLEGPFFIFKGLILVHSKMRSPSFTKNEPDPRLRAKLAHLAIYHLQGEAMRQFNDALTDFSNNGGEKDCRDMFDYPV